MGFQVDLIFIFLIIFDRDTFRGIDIDLMRKSEGKLDFSRSFHIELVSDTDDFE